MADHFFISYSNADGADFARQLADELEGGEPYINAWFDKRDLQPAEEWDDQIPEAIKSCKCLLFVMTKDSTAAGSVCKNEWTWALRYKRPVVPIRLHTDAETPFMLASRQWIDFSSNFEAGMARLRKYVERLDSPDGVRLEIKHRLEDAQRDLKRAKSEEEKARIETEINELKIDLRQQELIVKDPRKAEKQTRRSIDSGLQVERQLKKTVSGAATAKFINPPPLIAPDYFQGRSIEIQQIADFLQNDHQRILTIIGRAGGGKTALASYFLKHLESGKLPDELGELKIEGIVYLSEIGSHKVNIPNIYGSLLKLLPQETAGKLGALYRQPKTPIDEKIRSLLEAFQQAPVVLLLDNFESFVNTETENLLDSELKEVLEVLLHTAQHSIKVVITTRIPVRDLAMIEPARHSTLHLDEGLKSPYAENILRAMDKDGRAGFRDASEELLTRARELTLGFPRALESLYAIILVDRYTSIEELLSVELPETVVENLVGEAFSRLDMNGQKVMQALAVYNRPVPPAAVDFVLQFHIPGVNSAAILNRLVSMHFARREAGRYYLHPTDREYAFNRVLVGERVKRFGKGARGRVWNQYALLLRAADYYVEARKPENEWIEINDLSAQLAEFDLRCNAGDYEAAFVVLRNIDFDYLLDWGHYYLVIELNLRVKNTLTNTTSRLGNLNSLGVAHGNIAKPKQAIGFYEDGLTMARAIKDREWECVILMNLGGSYSALGDTRKALDLTKQAMALQIELDDREYESAVLCNLAGTYFELGDIPKAIELTENALNSAQKAGDIKSEVSALTNLANFLALDEQYVKAIDYGKQSISKGLRIGRTLSFEYGILAQAYLYNGELEDARSSIEKAKLYDHPENNHNVLVLLGIIALRQGELSKAQESFENSLSTSDEILNKTPEYYDALDVKGLALCGLTLIDGEQNLPDAIKCFRSARLINSEKGNIERRLRLFNELVKADDDGVLVEIRPVIEGKK